MVNLANNRIETIPTSWTDAWGSYDTDSGTLSLGISSKQDAVNILLIGNSI